MKHDSLHSGAGGIFLLKQFLAYPIWGKTKCTQNWPCRKQSSPNSFSISTCYQNFPRDISLLCRNLCILKPESQLEALCFQSSVISSQAQSTLAEEQEKNPPWRHGGSLKHSKVGRPIGPQVPRTKIGTVTCTTIPILTSLELT